MENVAEFAAIHLMAGRPHNHNHKILRTGHNRASNIGDDAYDDGDGLYGGNAACGSYDGGDPFGGNAACGSYDGGDPFGGNAGCGANVFPDRKVC
jgi:hypothetical protein